MALSIDCLTGIIYVPKADLTLVSGTLYELDVNWFRLQLKDWEDSDEGIVCLTTHNHNTEVTIAGTTFARTVELINGYRVEFEDGMYSIRLVGANNNLFDVENGILVQNQVQIISNNSAGLVVGSGGGGGGLTSQQVRDAMGIPATDGAPAIDDTVVAIRDIAEADEEMTATTATKKHKTTKAVLVQKNVSGGNITDPITLTE